MTTGQILLTAGVCLVVAALLLLVIGEAVLHNKKKKVLHKIENEYR